MEISEAKENLKNVVTEVTSTSHDWNEAETRFKIIDRLIRDCFDWKTDEFRLETSQGQDYTDYEIGYPVKMIWEAKREGRVFEVPVSRRPQRYRSVRSVVAMSVECEQAINQVNAYCLNRGVELAVATNGHQIIAFRADRNLTAAEASKCLVFESLDDLLKNFDIAWQAFSVGAISDGLLVDELRALANPRPPEKLSQEIPNYPQVRSPSDTHRAMQDIAELLLLNAGDQPDIEQQFYQECYCESGVLNQHSLVSKNMLQARYASLFPDAEDAPRTAPVAAKNRQQQLTPEILAEAISNRPIALVGDVGVGKTSFLKHLMYNSAFKEFQTAIYGYVDLGRKGALQDDPRELVLDSIEAALREKYQINIMKAQFVFKVYKDEIARFDDSIWGLRKDKDHDKYEEKLLEELDRLQGNRAEHLRRSIAYIAKVHRKQIIIAIDNADQRDTSIQQEAFVIAQNLAADWNATVFMSVRPRTFFYSKRSGALSAYPHRVFTISPPRVDEVVRKRLNFAMEIAKGTVQLERLQAISLRLTGISSLLDALLKSIDADDDIKVFLENITGGNIRELIQFLAGFFGNPNVDLRQITEALAVSGTYRVPVHELWKVALKGDNYYFDDNRVVAMNLFDVSSDDRREHFLCPMILGILNENSSRRNGEGFVSRLDIVSELQAVGFSEYVVDSALRRLNNKKLIESPERVTYEEDAAGLLGLEKSSFRISTLGAYHLRVWLASFSYLDAVYIDTPFFDGAVADSIRRLMRLHSLEDRYERAVVFRDYLNATWNSLAIKVSYFDWVAQCEGASRTFTLVERAVIRRRQKLS